MEQYISKAAVVAEIKRRIANLDKLGNRLYIKTDFPEQYRLIHGYESVLSFLDTLEVKEVDLDKTLTGFMGRYAYENGGEYPSAIEIAKHFFELGLKAQYDNWKVVDNTNFPQGDRTKIYCVFTKQRYILATVINHPQDEDLLQWKCTEFPFHRYDMCEGDKYMQIV